MRRLLPLLLLPALSCFAGAQARPVVLLDPARGGSEAGARFTDGATEKQVVLNLAIRLRSLLNARGIDVVLTREADVALGNDERASVANTAHPMACLLLHATPGGKGIHLYNSALPPADAASTTVPWNEAQSPFVTRSLRLTNELTSALSRSRLPVSAGLTWMHPLDNMQCPAVAVEVGPNKDGTLATDTDYQAEVAVAIAGALLSWRSHTEAAAPPAAAAAPLRSTPTPTEVQP